MLTQTLKHMFLYGCVILAGIIISIIFLTAPIQKKIRTFNQQPIPTPHIQEEKQSLTKEEQATMSASFIEEFRTLMSSEEAKKNK